jgi:hypothetical protein
MTRLCVRSEDRRPRLFPPVGESMFVPEAHTGLSPGEVLARGLLALADRPMTRRQRVLGRKLAPLGLLGRSLWLFREAMRSELAGRWGLADFFWIQSRDALRSLLDSPGDWDQVISSVGGDAIYQEEPPEPDEWACLLVDEVFIDTHCGFYNGCVPQPGVQALDQRAFDHVAAIEECMALRPEPASPGDRSSLLAPAWELRLKLARVARRWDDAREAIAKLRELFPERVEYLDLMVDVEVEQTMRSLVNTKYYPLVDLEDAERIDEGIERLEAFRREFPDVLSTFAALGTLHHLRGVKLASGGAVSEALVEAGRAQSHAPELEGVEATIGKISEQLQTVIEQGWAIRQDPRFVDESLLSQGLERICAESRKGDRPFREYLESGEPEETANALDAARDRDLWRRVGLPAPADRWDERSRALRAAVTKVLESHPTDRAEALRAWSTVVAGDEILGEIDPEPVIQFLLARISAGHAELKRREPDDAAGPVPRGEPPILPGPERGSRRTKEPFEFWLLGRRGLWLKVPAVAAAILLAVGIGMAVQRTRSDRAREQAYALVQRAEEARDYLGIIRGIESFLAHRPLWNRDPREGRLRALYDEAMVKWFVGRGRPVDAETRDHVDQYRRLAAGNRS